MAKKNEQTALKKGRASFQLIGKAKINDYTYKIENEYDSGWVDNQLNLGVDCGNGNVVYTEMRGGYSTKNDNVVYVHGIKEDENKKKQDDFENRFTIDWDDRNDTDILETIGNNCFITVGLEKDTNSKTFYKKFLSAYDAVIYIQEHLTDGDIINVKGNLVYQPYNNGVYLKKEITSIVLSKITDESKFVSNFTQTILLDSNSIGKKDAEHGTIGLDAYVVDYVGKALVNDKKVKISKNVTFPYHFEVAIKEDKPEITAKMLQKFFKVIKKTDITELTVEGNIIEGQAIVNVTEDDIPNDIKELIDMGIYTAEEAEAKCAIGNTNREKRLVITKPSITFVGTGENRKPTVGINTSKYKDTDKVFYSQLIAELDTDSKEDKNNKNDNKKEASETVENSITSDDDDLLAMLESV